jgi:tryptophan 7-halogenase
MKPITGVLVVGAECAGLLAAINLKAKLPQLRVRVLRHPIEDDFSLEGFATTPDFVAHLHKDLGINPMEFVRAVRPTWRLGTRYEWGPREFFDCTYEYQLDTRYAVLSRETGFYVGDSTRAFEAVGPASARMSQGRVFARGADGRPEMNPRQFGYHLERESLRKSLENLASSLGVIVLDGKVRDVIRGKEGVACLQLDGGQSLSADLFVDATGLESLLLNQTLDEPFCSFAPGLLCDRAVVATWLRKDEPIGPHASVRTLEAGWSWRMDHQRLTSCGYAFSSRCLDARTAETRLREIYPRCGSARLLTFLQGRRENCWVGNVVGVGNASSFVEPLAAAGPGILAFQCHGLAQSLVDCDCLPRPSLRKQFNKRWRRLVEGEREFLGLFYRYNTRLHTPFWEEARQSAYIGKLEPMVRCYQEIGPDSLHRTQLVYEGDPIGLEGYFSVLVGQSVPWSNPWRPPADELSKWLAIVDSWRRKASTALTVGEVSDSFFGSARPMRRGVEQRVLGTMA